MFSECLIGPAGMLTMRHRVGMAKEVNPGDFGYWHLRQRPRRYALLAVRAIPRLVGMEDAHGDIHQLLQPGQSRN